MLSVIKRKYFSAKAQQYTKQHCPTRKQSRAVQQCVTFMAGWELFALTADAIAADLASSSRLSKVSSIANSMCVGSRGLDNRYLWKYTR